MGSEEDEIKSKQASKKVGTLLENDHYLVIQIHNVTLICYIVILLLVVFLNIGNFELPRYNSYFERYKSFNSPSFGICSLA